VLDWAWLDATEVLERASCRLLGREDSFKGDFKALEPCLLLVALSGPVSR
jgi:hypothetical protein